MPRSGSGSGPSPSDVPHKSPTRRISGRVQVSKKTPQSHQSVNVSVISATARRSTTSDAEHFQKPSRWGEGGIPAPVSVPRKIARKTIAPDPGHNSAGSGSGAPNFAAKPAGRMRPRAPQTSASTSNSVTRKPLAGATTKVELDRPRYVRGDNGRPREILTKPKPKPIPTKSARKIVQPETDEEESSSSDSESSESESSGYDRVPTPPAQSDESEEEDSSDDESGHEAEDDEIQIIANPNQPPPELLALMGFTNPPRQWFFLRRNVRKVFLEWCQKAGVKTRALPGALDPDLEVVYIWRNAKRKETTFTTKAIGWLCPICNVHSKFATRQMLLAHLKWDHQEFEVRCSQVYNFYDKPTGRTSWKLQLTVPSKGRHVLQHPPIAPPAIVVEDIPNVVSEPPVSVEPSSASTSERADTSPLPSVASEPPMSVEPSSASERADTRSLLRSMASEPPMSVEPSSASEREETRSPPGSMAPELPVSVEPEETRSPSPSTDLLTPRRPARPSRRDDLQHDVQMDTGPTVTIATNPVTVTAPEDEGNTENEPGPTIRVPIYRNPAQKPVTRPFQSLDEDEDDEEIVTYEPSRASEDDEPSVDVMRYLTPASPLAEPDTTFDERYASQAAVRGTPAPSDLPSSQESRAALPYTLRSATRRNAAAARPKPRSPTISEEEEDVPAAMGQLTLSESRRSCTPPPQHDMLGPAARYPFLPFKSWDGGSDMHYSCRPGGPRIYDLLCTLSMEKFGVLAWEVEDREEEIFESDNLKDEEKVMHALWARWIMLHRNTFIGSYVKGTMLFIDEYWRMIHYASGWAGMRFWLLILMTGRFLTGEDVVKMLAYYEEKTEMKSWYPDS